jgi:hypothetical protein
MGRRRLPLLVCCTLLALLTLAAAQAPAAQPTVTVTLSDPLEGLPYVADLGETVVTVRADAVLTVRTAVVARPPAGWGGCITLASGLCMPVEMSVVWSLDDRPGGDPADGADSRVVATPARDATTWALERWNPESARWRVDEPPAAATDLGGVTWSISLARIGIAMTRRTPVSLSIRSRIVPLDPLGRALDPVVDDAGPLAIPFGGEAAPDAGSSPPPTAAPVACVRARARVHALERRIRRTARVARSGGPAARRRAARQLRRLRLQRVAARATARRTCARTSQPSSR